MNEQIINAMVTEIDKQAKEWPQWKKDEARKWPWKDQSVHHMQRDKNWKTSGYKTILNKSEIARRKEEKANKKSGKADVLDRQ